MQRKRLWTILLAVLTLVFVNGCMPIDSGSLSVCVRDGWSDQPIMGARVVIPETGDVMYTDAAGKTEMLTVPILYDRHFSGILPQTWGTVTVLVYAEGYYAVALYGVQMEKDICRSDMTVRLFPGDGSMGDVPFQLMESHDNAWVSEMLRRYGP